MTTAASGNVLQSDPALQARDLAIVMETVRLEVIITFVGLTVGTDTTIPSVTLRLSE